MKKKNTLLSVLSALILSISIVGSVSASAPPHQEYDNSGSTNECIKSGKCIRP